MKTFGEEKVRPR